MTNPSRPSTSCQIQRPSLTDDDDQLNNNNNNNNNNSNGKHLLSRSLTFDNEQKQQKQQQRITRPNRPAPPPLSVSAEQSPQRLGRSLLSNDNWRQETMGDVRVNARIIEQSDQNILFGKGKKNNNNNN